MKKKLIIFTLLITLAAPMRAQVFMIGDENYREPEDPEVFAGLPENFGLGMDWYVPVGDGLLLLAALGGAYLLNQRKKKNKK